jgi:hypothetical protein
MYIVFNKSRGRLMALGSAINWMLSSPFWTGENPCTVKQINVMDKVFIKGFARVLLIVFFWRSSSLTYNII